MEKIESLTQEQIDQLPEIAKECIGYGLCTDPIDQEKCKEAARKAYTNAGYVCPENFEFYESPKAGMIAANKALGNTKMEYVYPYYAQHEMGWLSFYYAFQKFGLDCVDKLDGLIELAKNAGWCWFFDELVIITNRPESVHLDEANRLHCENDMAIKYRDGFGIYNWHGVQVPEKVIMHPEQITVKDIDDETNAEVRRVMLERYGAARFIQDSVSELIAEDKFGKLYRRKIENDEDLVMVAVVNSTPEPDGHFKDYWIRVPENMKTPAQAVAWTFGLTEEEYKPLIET